MAVQCSQNTVGFLFIEFYLQPYTNYNHTHDFLSKLKHFELIRLLEDLYPYLFYFLGAIL